MNPQNCVMPANLEPTGARSAGRRDLFLVLLAAWAARLAFLLIVPPGARSVDACSWETVAQVLAAGGNPYHDTTFLNWPPLWMTVVFCLGKVSAGLGIPFFRVLQLFLILVESAVMVALLNLIREVAPAARARPWVMLGLALNPVAVLLVCQHGNFDVLVAWWLLLFLTSLLRWQRSNHRPDWLWACGFLGLGILTKTVPLVLVPLLAGGFRRAPRAAQFWGGLLLFGPVVLGMSLIYLGSPADVINKVLLYRSQMGYFGFDSLSYLAGADWLDRVHRILFYIILAAVLAGSGIFCWRRNGLPGGDAILYTALLLAAIPGLGPGYATQYIYWFMPLLVATCVCQPRWWRAVVAGFLGVAAATYLVEYALLPEYGCYLFHLWPATGQPAGADDRLLSVYCAVDSELGRTLLRLPLFAAYLALLGLGGGLLLKHLQSAGPTRIGTKTYAIAFLTPLVLAFLAIALAASHRTPPPAAPGQRALTLPSPLDPDARRDWEIAALNNLAWKLATSPDAGFRNGPLAIKAATRACAETQFQRPVLIGTLAAACAEAGRFDEAVANAQQAAALAARLGDTNLAQINQSLGAWYQGRQAYHEPAP